MTNRTERYLGYVISLLGMNGAVNGIPREQEEQRADHLISPFNPKDHYRDPLTMTGPNQSEQPLYYRRLERGRKF